MRNDPAKQRKRDKRFLDLAARTAMRSFGHVEPNPLVGCVIARGDEIIGIGRHERWGGSHAERRALQAAARRGLDVRGATCYVTLEPCSHEGKQPPCTLALIEAGVSEVVFASPDPNPPASGGAHVLEDAGMVVRCTDASVLASRISDPFLKTVRTGRPWVIAKWAQTLDGRIATRTGESQWISNEFSRRRVHRLRAGVDAIITGIGTVHVDDPMLTARAVRRVRREAVRVIIDTELSISLDAKVLRTAREVPTVLACSTGMASTAYTQDKRDAIARSGAILLPLDAQDMYQRHLDLGTLMDRLGAGLRVTANGLVENGVGVGARMTASGGSEAGFERRVIPPMQRVLVEAGAGLMGSMFDDDLIDEAVVYVAPLLLADEQARAAATGRVAASLSSGKVFELTRAKRLGNDLELNYRRI